MFTGRTPLLVSDTPLLVSDTPTFVSDKSWSKRRMPGHDAAPLPSVPSVPGLLDVRSSVLGDMKRFCCQLRLDNTTQRIDVII